MPVPAVIKGSDHFFVTTYEGNGGGQKVGKFVPFTDNGTILFYVLPAYDIIIRYGVVVTLLVFIQVPRVRFPVSESFFLHTHMRRK